MQWRGSLDNLTLSKGNIKRKYKRREYVQPTTFDCCNLIRAIALSAIVSKGSPTDPHHVNRRMMVWHLPPSRLQWRNEISFVFVGFPLVDVPACFRVLFVKISARTVGTGIREHRDALLIFLWIAMDATGYYINLQYITLYHKTLHRILSYYILAYDITPNIALSLLSLHTTPYHIVPKYVMSYYALSYCTTPHYTAHLDITLQSMELMFA